MEIRMIPLILWGSFLIIWENGMLKKGESPILVIAAIGTSILCFLLGQWLMEAGGKNSGKE